MMAPSPSADEQVEQHGAEAAYDDAQGDAYAEGDLVAVADWTREAGVWDGRSCRGE